MTTEINENTNTRFARRLLRTAARLGLQPYSVQWDDDPSMRVLIHGRDERKQISELTACSLALVTFVGEHAQPGAVLVVYDNAPDYADMLADFTDRPEYVRLASEVTGNAYQ